MRKKIIFYIILILITYGTPRQSIYLSALKQENPVDPRVKRLEIFFQRYNSPFVSHSKLFINEADKNGLDWRLLPVVSCVESSCGKHYQKNAFGWGSDSIDYGNDSDDIKVITQKIASLAYYQRYKKSKILIDFAMAYNGPYADTYVSKLRYFWERI